MDEIKRYKVTQNFRQMQDDLNKIEAMPEVEAVRAGLAKANSAYQKPASGIPARDLAAGVIPDVSEFITRAVNDLLHYYTKSEVYAKGETYTKAEVNSMVAAIKQFTIQSVNTLPQPPSAATMNILYLVPAEEPKVANEKDEFITVVKNGSYVWEQVGSTAIDLSGYVTTEALNAALEDYVTTGALTTALAGLNDVKYTQQALTAEQKAQARTNIGAGTYSKPSNGIPASDLARGVIPDVSQFITKSVNDLVNYYLKSEVYTKEEVQQRLSSLVGGFYVPVPELPEPSADTFGLKIYLVPSPDPKTGNLKDEYITVRSGSEGAYTYDWEQIGSTAIDLSGYVTTSALETALAGKVSPSDLEEFTVQELEALWDAAQGE